MCVPPATCSTPSVSCSSPRRESDFCAPPPPRFGCTASKIRPVPPRVGLQRVGPALRRPPASRPALVRPASVHPTPASNEQDRIRRHPPSSRRIRRRTADCLSSGSGELGRRLSLLDPTTSPPIRGLLTRIWPPPPSIRPAGLRSGR
jgi:hypothetical protein